MALQNYEENHSLELDWRAQRLSHTNPSTQQSIKITSEHKPENLQESLSPTVLSITLCIIYYRTNAM